MRYLVLFLLLSIYSTLTAQINPDAITIARDSFGVPHIFAKTDAEVAYGLAWVQCEDQFRTMQELMAACNGKLGLINGKDGVIADIGIQFMQIAKYVDENYDEEITGEFKVYLESFVQGVNDYAATFPDRVLLKSLFPITGRDVITGYLLGNVEISGAGSDLQRILNGRIKSMVRNNFPKGSNAIAVSGNKTEDGKTYLAINSHQPIEGWYSWYEAHLHSEEGMNIIGGTFAGGICIFHGANENLGWAHTVNHADFSDVFKLTINSDETAYLLDDHWIPLKKVKVKSKLKLMGFIPIVVSRTMYETDFGPAFKVDNEYYAWNFSARTTLKMAEQWYRMNKARNLEEFREALKMRGIVSTNIVYADREDNIYYLSNGRIPIRNPGYEWNEVLPGRNSELIWNDDLVPFDSLPQVLNPKCGYVFNTNNTPFSCTCDEENPSETQLNELMGYQSKGRENNRSLRFMELINQYEKLSYADFKRIKYDQQYPNEMRWLYGINPNLLVGLSPDQYSNIAGVINNINNWDRNTNKESIGATSFLVTLYLRNKHRQQIAEKTKNLPKEEINLAGIIYAMEMGKDYLLEHFGTIDVPLGDWQRHIRGNVSLPIGGGPDVLAAIYCEEYKEGTYRAVAGETYISMVKFSKDGVEVESINAFGPSEYLDDPNSTIQMEYFADQKLRRMSFDKENVLETAVKIYQPKTH